MCLNFLEWNSNHYWPTLLTVPYFPIAWVVADLLRASLSALTIHLVEDTQYAALRNSPLIQHPGAVDIECMWTCHRLYHGNGCRIGAKFSYSVCGLA